MIGNLFIYKPEIRPLVPVCVATTSHLIVVVALRSDYTDNRFGTMRLGVIMCGVVLHRTFPA